MNFWLSATKRPSPRNLRISLNTFYCCISFDFTLYVCRYVLNTFPSLHKRYIVTAQPILILTCPYSVHRQQLLWLRPERADLHFPYNQWGDTPEFRPIWFNLHQNDNEVGTSLIYLYPNNLNPSHCQIERPKPFFSSSWRIWAYPNPLRIAP